MNNAPIQGGCLLKVVRLLLLAALVDLHVMASVPWIGGGPTRWLEYLEWELPLSQIALVVLAGVLGPWRWYFRIPIAAGLLVAVGYFWHDGGQSGLPNWWMLFQVVNVSLVAGVLWCSGIRLHQRTDDQGRRLKFSLRGAFLVVSAIGISLGLIQAIRSLYGEAGVPVVIGAAILGLASAAVFVAALWAFLGTRCGLVRIVGFGLFLPIVGWLACHALMVPSGRAVIDITLLFVAYGLVLAISLLWVRLAGLRLGTYGRSGSDPPSAVRIVESTVETATAEAPDSINLTTPSD